MAAPSVRQSEHWERVFGEKRDDEVSWFQERPTISLDLIAKTGVTNDEKIVDVGAGASRLVDGLLDAGYHDLVVVDLAETALAKVRARLGARASEVQWLTRDVTQWQPETVFDVWHDRAVFHFMVRPEERDAYGVTLRRALKVGGHAILATFASDGPERCSGLPVVRYEPDELAVVLGSDFRRIESIREAHITPAGNVQSFQYSRFERIR